MPKLRSTEPFAPIADDAGDRNDAAPPAPRSTSLPADLGGAIDQLQDLTVADGGGRPAAGSPARDPAELPRHASLAPRSDAAGAGLRRTGAWGAASARPLPPPAPKGNEAMEAAREMSQRERLAAAREMFESVQITVEQLIGILEDWSEDRTPTRHHRDLGTLRERLRRKLSDLSVFAQVAAREPGAQSPFEGLPLRQLKRYQAALEAFDALEKDENRHPLASPNRALLRQLSRGFNERDEVSSGVRRPGHRR